MPPKQQRVDIQFDDDVVDLISVNPVSPDTPVRVAADRSHGVAAVPSPPLNEQTRLLPLPTKRPQPRNSTGSLATDDSNPNRESGGGGGGDGDGSGGGGGGGARARQTWRATLAAHSRHSWNRLAAGAALNAAAIGGDDAVASPQFGYFSPPPAAEGGGAGGATTPVTDPSRRPGLSHRSSFLAEADEYASRTISSPESPPQVKDEGGRGHNRRGECLLKCLRSGRG